MDNFLNFTLSPYFPLMIFRFVILMVTTWLIVDRLYFKRSKRRDFYFSFMLMSVAIFFLVYFMIFVLEDLKAKTSIGIGIGLFGIFSIMRYRTDAMPVREMTYMFLIIALSVVNAIANSVSIVELLATNALMFGSIWLWEIRLKQPPSKLVQYDRIELIVPERREELMADLTQRLGLRILDVEIGSVDFLRDMAMLKVFYESDHGNLSVNDMLKLEKDDLQAFN
ncbi:MAG: DUF4956 domain-containing protein [Prevotella sp.]|nr:DUF4956 domain-containing protein [Prevotella sp.]MDD4533571.1 DUF4956 domain-containing protein [Prevotella sp.]